VATKKDLTEAYAFSRRRLVTAFVSGAPGGREVEPARPGRTIVGGLALAVLLVAGAAVAGVFSPRVEEGWTDQPGLIVSKESGAAYVITNVEDGEEPVLRPVINITSAKLILGSDAAPTIIPDEHIDREQRGDDIGILGAPANVPDTDRLVDDDWTACTTPGSGIRLRVSTEAAVEPAPSGGALLVRVAGGGDRAVHVVAEGAEGEGLPPRAYSYRVPPSPSRDNLLGAIGLPEAGSAQPVPEEWLALFPRGGDLTREAFGLEGVGRPAAYARDQEGLSRARVGDVLDTGSEQLLLTQDGPAALDELAAAVYLGAGDETTHETSEPPVGERVAPPYADARWPSTLLQPLTGEHCAELSASADQRPAARIVTAPSGDASADGVGRRTRSVVVDEGAGAYVLSGAWDQTEGGDPHLVDSEGQRYPLVGADATVQLGYAGYPAPHVPDSWIELFHEGVPLSTSAALCPPTTDPGRPCD
jgi:type VII secretion protein EccB